MQAAPEEPAAEPLQGVVLAMELLTPPEHVEDEEVSEMPPCCPSSLRSILNHRCVCDHLQLAPGDARDVYTFVPDT
jgi:hypothetical protein